ncbi:hypothetical protein Peur_016701 [Populus x canadensis]
MLSVVAKQLPIVGNNRRFYSIKLDYPRPITGIDSAFSLVILGIIRDEAKHSLLVTIISTPQASSCILVEQILQGLMNQMVPFKFWWYSDHSSPFLSYKSITSGSKSAANPRDYSFTVYCLINTCGFPLNLRLQLLDISAGMA